MQLFKQRWPAVLLALALAGHAHGAADSWPMFRGGPQLLGVAAGSLSTNLVPLWNFKTGGPVKSSPAIVDGRVFAGSEDGFIYALDFATGKKLWSFKTGGGVESSPLVLDGTVFAGSQDGLIYALNVTNGALLWKHTTGDKILGSPNWVPSAKGKSILIGGYDYKLHCVDAVTGRSNWVYETGNFINGSPAVANGRTVFGGCDALLHVIALTNGTQVKEVDAGAYVPASLAFVDDMVYFGHAENEFHAVNLAKGTNLWIYRDRSFGYFSSPAVTKDRVIFGGRDKRLHCVKRETGEAVWTFSTRGKVDSSPVVCGDKIVVGSDDGRLYLVALKDGAELWSHEMGQALDSSPAVADGKVVIGSNDGAVYCFGQKGNRERPPKKNMAGKIPGRQGSARNREASTHRPKTVGREDARCPSAPRGRYTDAPRAQGPTHHDQRIPRRARPPARRGRWLPDHHRHFRVDRRARRRGISRKEARHALVAHTETEGRGEPQISRRRGGAGRALEK